MADSPATSPGDFMGWFVDPSNLFTEPRNYELISTTEPCNHELISAADAAAFTFDLSEMEAQLDNDPEAFSQSCQFPGHQMDFSSHVATKQRTDQLQTIDQQPHDKNVSGDHMRQYESRGLLPNSGAGSNRSRSPTQFALVNDEPGNGSNYVLDRAQKQYPKPTASLPEGSTSDTSWRPPPIESGTLKQKNPEQAVVLKRHLDEETYSPIQVNNKRKKMAAYEYPNHDPVGTVEASFFEDWLSKFPDVYPGPEQFVLLAGLTKVRTETVQSWFNKRLRNGPRSITFTNSLMEPSAATEAPDLGIPQMNLIRQPSDQPVQQPLDQPVQLPIDRTLDKVKLEASNWVREHKAQKCSKRRNPKNFVRDPKKPYCCTLGCGTKFKDKDDWRKHEERNYPQGGWICDVGSIVHFEGRTLCAFCGILNPKTEHGHGKASCSEKKVTARGRLHFRKQHFSQHFIRVHPGISCDRYLENNHFTVKSKFPRRCGFCRYLSKHWRDRIEHIGGHFIAGKDMSQWDFEVEDDEVDQAKSADHENSDNDGDFNGKRYRPSDHESDSSEDDSNGSPKSAPKQRRHNARHTYARQTCGLLQSTDVNSSKDCGRTAHIHQESHDVPLNESFLDLDFPNLETESLLGSHSTISATIIHLVPRPKLTQPFIKAVLKRKKPLPLDRCRLFTSTNEVMAIKRSRHYLMPHWLRISDNSAYSHLWADLSTRSDLISLIQSDIGTVMLNVEDIAPWCKLLNSGNKNSDTQLAISATRYAPELSDNLSATWSAELSSLASLLLDTWRLLDDDDKVAFKIFLNEILSISPLCHESFAQSREWIDLLRNNCNLTSTQAAPKVPHVFNIKLTVQHKDTTSAFDFPSHLYPGIHLQPVEQLLLPVVENQNSVSSIRSDTTSEVSMAFYPDVQSASGRQDTSEVAGCHAPMCSDDLAITTVKSITSNSGNAAATSAQTDVSNETFREQKIDLSLSSISNDLLSSYAAETYAPSNGLQSEFYDNGIDSSLAQSWSVLHDSFFETNVDSNSSSTAQSPYSTDIVSYVLQHEPLTGLPLTENWLQSTAPWGVTFAAPATLLDYTSPIFPNLGGYDLSSAPGIQEPTSSIAEDLGSNTALFLSPSLTTDATEHCHTPASSKTYKVSEISDYSSHKQRKGIRNGSMSSLAKSKAAAMRKKMACIRCRRQRVACDMNDPCNRCRAVSLDGRLCVRTRMKDFFQFLLPETITSRYSETAVQVAISRQIGSFTDNIFEILVSTGSTFPPISITVCEFIPLSRQSLQPSYTLLTELNDMPVRNKYPWVPPLVLSHSDRAAVRDKLLRHAKAMLEGPRHIDETISGETWIVSYKAFEAVDKYRRAGNIREKDGRLELAFELHIMHFIMKRLFIIEPSSTSQIFAKLQRPHVLSYIERTLSSEIIDLQLKCVMVTLLREKGAQVLGGLERILATRQVKQIAWFTAFCLIIVVSSCIEAVEIATDETTVLTMKEAEMTSADKSRAKHCQELEQVVFEHVTAVFMTAYKSHRTQSDGGFNPIRDGLELNEEKGINLPMVELVEDVRKIIDEYEDDIHARAKDPKFEIQPEKLLDHTVLKKQLSGRLVSKFLISFGWQRPQSTENGPMIIMNDPD